MREALEARSGLSPEQIDTLCAFGQALIEKNKVMNLTAITEPQAVAELHFLDCIALLRDLEKLAGVGRKTATASRFCGRRTFPESA